MACRDALLGLGGSRRGGRARALRAHLGAGRRRRPAGRRLRGEGGRVRRRLFVPEQEGESRRAKKLCGGAAGAKIKKVSNTIVQKPTGCHFLGVPALSGTGRPRIASFGKLACCAALVLHHPGRARGRPSGSALALLGGPRSAGEGSGGSRAGRSRSPREIRAAFPCRAQRR